MREEPWGGPDDSGEPLTRAFWSLAEAFVFAAYPFPQVEVDPAQTVIERRLVVVAVIVDPAADVGIKHSGQIIEGLVGPGLETPAPDITAHLLEFAVSVFATHVVLQFSHWVGVAVELAQLE